MQDLTFYYGGEDKATAEKLRYNTWVPECFANYLRILKDEIYGENEELKDFINDFIDWKDYQKALNRYVPSDEMEIEETQYDVIPDFEISKLERIKTQNLMRSNNVFMSYALGLEYTMFEDAMISVTNGLVSELEKVCLTIDEQINRVISEQNTLKNNIEIVKRYINNIYTAEIQKEKQKRIALAQKLKTYIDEYNRRVAQLRIQAGQV